MQIAAILSPWACPAPVMNVFDQSIGLMIFAFYSLGKLFGKSALKLKIRSYVAGGCSWLDIGEHQRFKWRAISNQIHTSRLRAHQAAGNNFVGEAMR